MSTTYNFIICKHSIDGLRVATTFFPPDSTRRLALLSRDNSSAPLYFGHYCPPDYAGLSGLFQYDAEALAVKRMDKDVPIRVVFPSLSESERPHSELLDRLRVRLINWGMVNVVLFYKNLTEDLPPMTEKDQLICLWEVRDTPGEKDIEAMTYLQERLRREKARFQGIKFYGRLGADDKTLQSTVQEIEKLQEGKKLQLLRI
jgi:hypothetical protein